VNFIDAVLRRDDAGCDQNSTHHVHYDRRRFLKTFFFTEYLCFTARWGFLAIDKLYKLAYYLLTYLFLSHLHS